jgi:hypothetical protein
LQTQAVPLAVPVPFAVGQVKQLPLLSNIWLELQVVFVQFPPEPVATQKYGVLHPHVLDVFA